MVALSGRKTGGIYKETIHVFGYPTRKKLLQEYQMLIWRLKRDFVEEVMEPVELTPLSGASVGLPGVDGLSTEQRKRLTIAVELVANPSIVFMDEQLHGCCYCDEDREEYCEYRPNNRVHWSSAQHRHL